MVDGGTKLEPASPERIEECGMILAKNVERISELKTEMRDSNAETRKQIEALETENHILSTIITTGYVRVSAQASLFDEDTGEVLKVRRKPRAVE
jgi:hypothetical protein